MTHLLRYRHFYLMNRFLFSDSSKWLFVIGLVAIGAGITAKNVISYPSQCMTEEMLSSRKPLLIAHVYEDNYEEMMDDEKYGR